MVLVVFALLVGLLFLAKKRGLASIPLMGRRGGTGARRMEILERVPLTPQHAIHLVRVSGKVVLIGTAPSSCTILDAAIPESLPSSLPQNIVSTGQ